MLFSGINHASLDFPSVTAPFAAQCIGCSQPHARMQPVGDGRVPRKYPRFARCIGKHCLNDVGCEQVRAAQRSHRYRICQVHMTTDKLAECLLIAVLGVAAEQESNLWPRSCEESRSGSNRGPSHRPCRRKSSVPQPRLRLPQGYASPVAPDKRQALDLGVPHGTVRYSETVSDIRLGELCLILLSCRFRPGPVQGISLIWMCRYSIAPRSASSPMPPVAGTGSASSSTSPLQVQWATPPFTTITISFQSCGL